MMQNQNSIINQRDSCSRSYLLRVWQEAPLGADRVVLQDVLSNKAQGFSSLESLFTFLKASWEESEGADCLVNPKTGGRPE